ncbi:protein kinase [Chlorogloeopsis sp. ULAP01]|uniref:serine/threonine protein kinase n=1 Tax=Chlorogloeopsis sp. ULAP01 TaxID=3056483 RepID=UPI0030151D46
MQAQELVVIKLLTFNHDFEWSDLKLFEREAETLKSLSHPSIPRYLDYFEVNSPQLKGFALVQTYLPVKTLEEYVKAGCSFTETELKDIAKALLEILIYLHNQKPPVIHRDIKPSNILLGDRSGNHVGKVYLVDFGSVQNIAATEGGTITIVGTYGYMPPEQFVGRGVPASDIYSLGATLIYLATGTHPADLPQKDLRLEFELLVNFNSGFTNWLKWATEPSLEKRLASSHKALQVLKEEQPTDASNFVTAQLIDSKIKLIKDTNSLKIIFPSMGFRKYTKIANWSVIGWNSFVILFCIITAIYSSYPVNINFFVLALPFLVIGLFMLYGFIYALFGNIKLEINSEQITLMWQLFGLKFHCQHPSARKDITKLIYIPQHLTTTSKGRSFDVPPQIILWAGVRKYQLTGIGGAIQSETEVQWLAQELSEWLGLPIRRDQ